MTNVNLTNHVTWMGGQLPGTVQLTRARNQFDKDAAADSGGAGTAALAAQKQQKADGDALVNSLVNTKNTGALTALEHYRADEVHVSYDAIMKIDSSADKANAAADLQAFEGMLTKGQANLFGRLQTDNTNVAKDIQACSGTIKYDFNMAEQQRTLALINDGI